MKNLTYIFNPYGLLILAVFVEYFPLFFSGVRPSISFGQVNLFISDIAFIFLALYAFFKQLNDHSTYPLNTKNMGREIQIIFIIFFAFSWAKWLFQGDLNTGTARMMFSYAAGYLFLIFFPMHMARKGELGKLFPLLVIFLIYIFILHIYAFATEGFKIHILGGAFLSMLGPLYFLAARKNALLKLSATQSFFVKALVITIYFMVGHRSGLIALMLGIVVYWFYYKKSAIKEMLVLVAIVTAGAGIAMIASPKILSGIEDRASSTFDASQDTYQGRFYNIFTVLQLSKEYPLIGKPLVTNESVQYRSMEVERGNTTSKRIELVVTPHNLALEWLLYYGWIGECLGLTLLFLSVRFIKRFLRENKHNIQRYQIGVVMSCTLAHNLFFAFSNPTTDNVYATFFLYFPLVVLMAINRNKEIFMQRAPTIQ